MTVRRLNLNQYMRYCGHEFGFSQTLKILGVLFVGLLTFLTEASGSTPGSDTNRMLALKQAVEDAQAMAYSTNDTTGKFYEAWKELEKTNVLQILLLAEQEPKSEAAFDALLWVAMNTSAYWGPLLTNRLEAIECLETHHATHLKVGSLCNYLGRSWKWKWRNKPVEDFLIAVEKNNPDRAVRGQAALGLGRIYACKAEELVDFENSRSLPFFAKQLSSEDLIQYQKSGTSQQAAAAAEKQFNEVIARYGDCLYCKDLQESPSEKYFLKDLAERDLFALLHLSVGKTVPEIEAEGVSGEKMKLSESRGKICVLCFWASWCGPCMEMVPIERALAERMRGKPFSLIGVNGDSARSDAKRVMEREQMNWPSFWNGERGPGGAISTAWNIHGWPTVFVIDAEGVIRFKFLGCGSNSSNRLNESVDELMQRLVNKK